MSTAVPLPAAVSSLRPVTPAEMNDALLALLSEQILTRAAGAHLPAGGRLPGQPQQQLWLGQLASEPMIVAETAAGRSPGFIPPAQGFSLRLASLPARFDVELNFTLYLALHPTVDEQRDHHDDPAQTPPAAGASLPTGTAGQGATRQGGTTAQGGTGRGGNARGGRRPEGKQLATVWTKVPVGPVRVSVTIPAGAHGSYTFGETDIADAIDDAVRRARAGQDLFRPRRQHPSPQGSLPRPDDMVDATTWATYAAGNLVEPAELTPARFAAALEVDALPDGGATELLFTVVNRSPAPDDQRADLAGVTPYGRAHVDSNLYEVELQASTTTPLLSYSLEQVAQSYRYDRTVTAFGHNSPVETPTTTAGTTATTTATNAAGTTTLATTFGAQIQTWRVHPRTKTQAGTPIDTSFATVSADPVAAVQALVNAQDQWVQHAWSPAELARLATLHGWTAQAAQDAQADAAEAVAEVQWVRDGLTQLAADPDLREAFTMMNTVMAKIGARRSYTSWHPFQLAWIVGCLPALVDPAKHPQVNIVWFATGGGKSEAYLGLMLVELFFGRLTGVRAGSQVWARFPLRLLALQQTERFAEVVLLAELERRAHPKLAGADPLGVGFYVGSGNTPNKLYGENSTFGGGVNPDDPALAENCRVLEFCPVCDPTGAGPRIEVRFNRIGWTMEHLCTNAQCPMHGALPIWTIDDDIYRHAPSVLVGTVDKLAQMAQAGEFAVLLGQAHSHCPAHGYSASPLWCAVFGCKATRTSVPGGFTGIRMEIADELHLLDESLGALDGMYETLLQQINDALSNRPMTIVAATATLEGYQNQVKHLYQRQARRFPVSGPQAGENFWAYTSAGDPMRRFLGVRPRGITMVTAAREVALLHAQWLTDLLSDAAGVATRAGLPVDPVTLAHISTTATDLYQVLLTYCLRKEDLSSFTRDQQVVDLLRTSRNLAVIGGDAKPGDIREAVARLAAPPADPDEQVRLIAATKAIGHGFDSPRLGVMTVMGTPTQAAEVIQATARVGRRHPGLVVHIFNPSRDRDASVFRYYTTWVSYLDRLVHKVPVNRESLPVLRRVLSGALMAWLLMVHDRRWLTGGTRRKSLSNSAALKDALINGTLDRTTLIDELQIGLGLDPTRIAHQLHRAAVSDYIDNTLATLNVSAAPGKRTGELLDPPVPRSLRDVEEPIRVYGDI
jgi:hypothetical protein